jgi:hypothetical protein
MRKLATYEGVVENGYVRLPPNVEIPDETRVYILVPNIDTHRTLQILSPRLVDRGQAKDFVKEIIDETPNASL